MPKLPTDWRALALAGLGVLCILRAIIFDTAPEGTHNIGLMQAQSMWMSFGSLCCLIAALFVVGANITRRVAAAERDGSA